MFQVNVCQILWHILLHRNLCRIVARGLEAILVLLVSREMEIQVSWMCCFIVGKSMPKSPNTTCQSEKVRGPAFNNNAPMDVIHYSFEWLRAEVQCLQLHEKQLSAEQSAVCTSSWQPPAPSSRAALAPSLFLLQVFFSLPLCQSHHLTSSPTSSCSVVIKLCFIDSLSEGAWDEASIFSLIPTVWSMFDGLLLNP